MEEVRRAIAKCDLGCPNGHYTKVVDLLPVDLRGHPIVCYNDDLLDDVHQRSMHLLSTGNHFNVAGSVRKINKFLTCQYTDSLRQLGKKGVGALILRRLPHYIFYYCTEVIHFMILFLHVGEEECGSV